MHISCTKRAVWNIAGCGRAIRKVLKTLAEEEGFEPPNESPR